METETSILLFCLNIYCDVKADNDDFGPKRCNFVLYALHRINKPLQMSGINFVVKELKCSDRLVCTYVFMNYVNVVVFGLNAPQ